MVFFTKNIYRITVVILFIIDLTLGLACYYEQNDGLLKIYFLDVGQGDSIYVRSPNGNDMLVDSGPSNMVLSELSKVMPWYDRKIDLVVETHPDSDHISGFPDIFKRYTVGIFMETSLISKSAISSELKKLQEEKKINNIRVSTPLTVDFGDGTKFRVLFPDKDVSNFKNTNDASIVGQVIYGSTTTMLTGDSPKKIEKYLVTKYGAILQSDVLKIGHHGSKNSSDINFLKTIVPKYAVISVATKNRYGHPNKEVLDMLSFLNIKILRTDQLGTIAFVSDGKQIWQK